MKAPRSGYTPLPVAWGISVIADPAKMIGRSLFTTGIYDLAVSEVLARLIEPGDTVVDAGANVGYMTLLAGVAAGSSRTRAVVGAAPGVVLGARTRTWRR